MEICHYWTQQFPWTTLTLVEHEGDLIVCSFGADVRFIKSFLRQHLHKVKLVRAREPLAQAVKELREYFAGKRREFTVPVALYGTEFQRKVWAQLRKIAYGETASYQGVARAVRNARLARAVGAASGANPVAIVVPCHRVIGADGKLTGYGGGIEMKRKLLQLEGALLL